MVSGLGRLQRCVGALVERIRGERLVRLTVVNGVGTIVARGCALLAAILVARSLGKANFGRIGIVQSTVAAVQVFGSLGLGMTATKFIAQYRLTDRLRAGRIHAVVRVAGGISGVVAAGLLFFGARWLARVTLSDEAMAPLLQVAAPSLFFATLNGVQLGALAGLSDFRTIAVVNAVVGAVTLPAYLIGAKLGGTTGVVAATSVVAATGWLLSGVLLRARFRSAGISPCRGGWGAEIGIVPRFALPALLQNAMVAPVLWAAAALLVNQPRGYEEMGILNAANQWFTVILFLPMIAAQVLLPLLSEIGAKDEAGQTARLLRQAVAINAAVVIPVTAAILLCGPFIMAAYGKGFSGGLGAFAALVLSAALSAIMIPCGQLLAARDRLWLGTALNAGWAIVLFGAAWVLASHGAAGIASARLIAYVCHAVWTIVAVRWVLRGLSRRGLCRSGSSSAFAGRGGR